MKETGTKLVGDGLRVMAWSIVVGGIASILMLHVWNQYRIMEVGYEIADVTSEHRKLMEQNKKLSIEAAVVGRTERLSNLARERYGLEPVAPFQVQTLTISTDEQVALVVE